MFCCYSNLHFILFSIPTAPFPSTSVTIWYISPTMNPINSTLTMETFVTALLRYPMGY